MDQVRPRIKTPILYVCIVRAKRVLKAYHLAFVLFRFERQSRMLACMFSNWHLFRLIS
jgi:hypothetical protein